MPLFGSLTFEEKVPELTSWSSLWLTPINPQFPLLCEKSNRAECQKRKTCCPQSHNWEKLCSHCKQERDFMVNHWEEPQDSEGSSAAQPKPSPHHHEDTSHTLVSFDFHHIAPLVHLMHLTSQVSLCFLKTLATSLDTQVQILESSWLRRKIIFCTCHGFNLSLPGLLLCLQASLFLHHHYRWQWPHRFNVNETCTAQLLFVTWCVDLFLFCFI